MDKEYTDENILELETNALKNAADDPWRLRYHLMPISGWLNDPNGLCENDGKNHIYFQYAPHGTGSAHLKCWGHYETDDFINYTYTLPVMYPDQDFDKNGVYSGSAFLFDNGIRAYYTGNVKYPGEHDYITSGREHNVVVAEDYDREREKFNKKTLLLKNEDYPSDLTQHVRDPKIIYRDGVYQMLLGARSVEDRGLILVYESDDGYDWHLKTRLESSDELGYMWECPDLIQLDGKDILILSPQGIEPVGFDFNNLYQSGYMFVDDYQTEPKLGPFRELDRGFDFYAPQTYVDENGRTILIGWMGLPDVDYKYPTEENGWIHALTIPRLLSVKNGKLYQEPLPELEKLRTSERKYQLGEREVLNVQIPDACEIVLTEVAPIGILVIREGCILAWSPVEGEDDIDGDIDIFLTFESDDNSKIAGAGRDSRRGIVEEIKKIRVFVDTSSIEVFINDGEMTFTTRYFPDPDNHSLEVESDWSELKVYPLDAFSVKRSSGEVIF